MALLLNICISLTVLAALLYLRLLRAISPTGLPRVGKPGVRGFIATALRFTIDAEHIIEEGRKEFAGRPFALPTPTGDMIVLGPEHLDILRTSNDEIFNQPIAINEALQLDYTMNSEQLKNPYQAAVVRTDLTRAIASLVPEVIEESQLTLNSTFAAAAKPGTTATIPVFNTMTHLIARVSNRVMFGPTLCRDEGFLHAIVQFAETITLFAPFIKWSPVILRSTVYAVLSSVFGGKKGALRFIVPYLRKYLEERKRVDDELPTFSELLIRSAPPHETTEGLAMRIMNMNFGSIHTSSIFITQALFELALLQPSQVDEIRAEIVEAVEAEGGLNKAAIARFRKLDSLLREVGRMYGLGFLSMARLTTRDCELGDGTRIPAGYTVALDIKSCHFDAAVYPDAHRFDAFRFSKMRDEGSGAKYAFTTIDSNYIPFGAGRHACPGRFFAAMELKVLLALICMNFDVAFPGGVEARPPNLKFNAACVPDTKAEMVFGRREAPGLEVLRV